MNKEIDTSIGRFDFNKALKVTITKGIDNDSIVAEFEAKEANFIDTKDAELILKIGNKKYKVIEIVEKITKKTEGD